MSTGLDRLNSLPPGQAEGELLKCCASRRWASTIADSRPFANVDQLFEKAERVWWSLGGTDWLEAFHAHPKIGEQKAAAAELKEAQDWSAQEQSGTRDASADTIVALAAGNHEYERRFGFIFIICATGKSSDEMLEILNRRLRNSPETELQIAAEEQRKITRLRLEKLLKNLGR